MEEAVAVDTRGEDWKWSQYTRRAVDRVLEVIRTEPPSVYWELAYGHLGRFNNPADLSAELIRIYQAQDRGEQPPWPWVKPWPSNK